MKILTGFKGVNKTNEDLVKNLIELLKKHDTILSKHIDSKVIAQSAIS